ncbi:ATP-binding protein [Azospirillum sp. ST 5-10]|uniref:ATP-binding protein n=1 Tax=unclassified Azospirillum TaxID=2630922 RepID=UPI003F4A11EC
MRGDTPALLLVPAAVTAAPALAAILAGADRPVWDTAVPAHWAAQAARCWPPRAPFAAVLTARAACRDGVVPAVVAWAAARGHLAESDRLAAETALSDALANAVLHGSLELPGRDRFGASLDAHFEAVAERLASDAYGLRPVGLTWRPAGRLLLIHVDDVGPGYAPPPHPALVPPTALSGRGHLVMATTARRVRRSRGGRRTTLGFRRA